MTHFTFRPTDPPGVGSALLLIIVGVLSILIGIRKRPQQDRPTPLDTFVNSSLPQLSVFGGIVSIFLGFFLLLRLVLGR